MAAVDRLLDAAVLAVKNSGLIESVSRMATVTAVNGDGTIDVQRNGDTFPSVRLLMSHLSPLVGDTVQILKSRGGYVCIGIIASTPPLGSVLDIRTGRTRILVPATNTTYSQAVTFPKLRGSNVSIQATVISTVPGSDVLGLTVASASTSGFTAYLRRTSATDTDIYWTAMSYV
ncbi:MULTISPECIES: hypothetical protein [Streptomyces]|uniref:hypothetical protein n=1 Tax=Streptomyces TaxID=1883 RepID=UPI00160496A5|nr:hypothetical protein [Streptomyces murinus]MBA9050789.1 hypothetical protein [Streptomyces murinus]